MRFFVPALCFLLTRAAQAQEGFLYFPFGESHDITCNFCCSGYPIAGCHRAIDYRARNDTAIFAAAAGIVDAVENGHPPGFNRKGGLGNYVRIRHLNNYRTIYAHLARGTITVRNGDTVELGQQIALSDNSGFSLGPHLHFEVRDPDGQRVNPYGDPADYEGGCGPDALWATCPPRPYVDIDSDGYTVSDGDCDDTDPAINPEAEDRCDGVDNDCSGAADEAFVEAGLFTRCSVGIGGCNTTGTWICTAEGDGLFCTAPPVGVPRPEICDGQDNDCNGEVDDGEAAASCDNGIFCDGEEVCVVGRCELGAPVVCNDGVDCTIDLCVEATHTCSTVAAHERCDDGNLCTADQCTPSGCRNEVTLDADGDGFISDGCAGGTDCNDSDPAINPEAVEVCDGQDNDCNGEVDDELTTSAVCDNGIFCDGAEVCAGGACAPGEPIVCEDGIDCTVDRCSPRGCTHQADNSVCDDLDPCTDDWCTASGCRHPLSLDMDADRDGFYSATCSGGNDCNDSNPAINPEAEEICNEVDDNCDGEVDEEVLNACGECGLTPDCWHAAVSTIRAPSARLGHTAAWTGSEMIIWGGCIDTLCDTVTATGGRYDPDVDTWAGTATIDAPLERHTHTAVWTGSEMIVWGGLTASSGPTRSGALYDPVDDTWRMIDTFNMPTRRYYHTAVWTGSEMIVWGGYGSRLNVTETGGRYNPVEDRWIPTSFGDFTPTARTLHTAVWTGSEMIVWGGWLGYIPIWTGGKYDPLSDLWTMVSNRDNPRGRYDHSAVWTGSEMLIWGGWDGTTFFDIVFHYYSQEDVWIPGGSHDGRRAHSVVWAGSEMIIWGGENADNEQLGDGQIYDPILLTWSSSGLLGASPSARRWPTAVWTGSEMIVWGGFTDTGLTNTGGRYTPP